MARRTEDRRRQRQQTRERAAAAAAARAERRRRTIGIVVVLAMALATVGAIIAATSESTTTATTTTTASTLPGDAVPGEQPPVAEVPLPPAGEVLGADYPCPAEDGSSPRATSFGGPPPTCIATLPDGSIDPATSYRARLATSAGELTFLLNTEQAPQTVNDFVVLARYHYFDGAPFDTVLARGWAELGGRFDDGGSSPYGGFLLPGEAPEVGTIPFPGALAALPADPDAAESEGGRFLVAIGEQAANLPERTTFFGLLLDGTEAFPDLILSGTSSGVPSQVITVESVTIEATADPDAG